MDVALKKLYVGLFPYLSRNWILERNPFSQLEVETKIWPYSEIHEMTVTRGMPTQSLGNSLSIWVPITRESKHFYGKLEDMCAAREATAWLHRPLWAPRSRDWGQKLNTPIHVTVDWMFVCPPPPIRMLKSYRLLWWYEEAECLGGDWVKREKPPWMGLVRS